MSSVNIKGIVENIKSGTTIYTPLVDVVINGIEAIESKKETKGEIKIIVGRSKQSEADASMPAVVGFEICDNGIGFTKENRDSFDELYSDQKIAIGGKGFGRFVCLKYFEDVSIDSHYKDGETIKNRTFRMGKKNDIIEDKEDLPSSAATTGTRVALRAMKINFPDKNLDVMATHLVEKLLPYFTTQGYVCPRIEMVEEDESNSIVLNDYVDSGLSSLIVELDISNPSFTLTSYVSGGQNFRVRVFKFYSPGSRKSKISLVAHKREVTDTAIHVYIPEFIDEFYETINQKDNSIPRNYIIKAYVFGDYLDGHVSLERGRFEFQKDGDLFYGISQNQIEKAASDVAQSAVGEDVKSRQEKKKYKVESYVEEQAPWHREALKELDLSDLSFKPSDEEIEIKLQRAKFDQEVSIRREVNKLLATSSIEKYKDDVTRVVEKISDTSKNDLVHYVALRKHVLDLFEKSLELDPNGSYSSEGVVHDIIFPRKGDNLRLIRYLRTCS